MTALAGPRIGSIRFIDRDFRPMAANAKIWPGASVGPFVASTPSGYYAQVQPGVYGVGIATGLGGTTGAGGIVAAGSTNLQGGVVDNTGGANGAMQVEINYIEPFYVRLFANDTASPVVVADRGNVCYGLDDQTVTHTANSGANLPTGCVYDVTTEGVWVKMRAGIGGC